MFVICGYQASTLTEMDAPGYFVRYLYNKQRIYACPIRGRYDIGGLQSYIECEKQFAAEQQQQHAHTDASGTATKSVL